MSRWHRAGTNSERGSAIVEFVGGSVLLLLPLVYLLLTVFDVQRTTFGVTEAAREAGRAFATAPTVDVGIARATLAARLALADQGSPTVPSVRFTADGAGCGAAVPDAAPSLAPGSRLTVCVAGVVLLPFVSRGLLAHVVPARISVVGRFVLAVDRYRSAA